MELINSNFRYLRGPYPELYRAGKTCELLIDIDADACSSKLRYFAEVWLLYWAHAQGKVLAANGLYSMIQKSIQLGLLNNDDVVEQLHHLRNIGNVGAHISINSITGEIERTFVTKQQLKSCLNVANTLLDRFHLGSSISFSSSLSSSSSSMSFVERIRARAFSLRCNNVHMCE